MLSLLFFHLVAHHPLEGFHLTLAHNALDSDVDLAPEHACESAVLLFQAHAVSVSKDGLVEHVSGVVLVVSCEVLLL